MEKNNLSSKKFIFFVEYTEQPNYLPKSEFVAAKDLEKAFDIAKNKFEIVLGVRHMDTVMACQSLRNRSLPDFSESVCKSQSLRRIESYLLEAGIKPNNKGFECLKIAIDLIIRNPEYKDQITKVLYPEVSKVLSDVPTRIERSIRYSLESAGIHITNSEFLSKAAIDLSEKVF